MQMGANKSIGDRKQGNCTRVSRGQNRLALLRKAKGKAILAAGRK
jgi:hypothetical protein